MADTVYILLGSNVGDREKYLQKALDKLETILQHNQGDNPPGFDYSFNLEYGKKYTEEIPLATRIREILDAETAAHAQECKNDNQTS